MLNKILNTIVIMEDLFNTNQHAYRHVRRVLHAFVDVGISPSHLQSFHQDSKKLNNVIKII